MMRDNIALLSGVDMSRRRAQRKGYVFERGPSWFLQYREDFLDASGNLCRKKKKVWIGDVAGPNKIGKRRADDLAREILTGANASNRRPASLATLKEFIDSRFRIEHVWALEPGGQEHYNTIINKHITPAFGGVPLRELTLQQVQALCRAKIDGGLSVQTVVHIRNVLSAIYEHARIVGYWPREGTKPTDGVVLPRMVRKERGALSIDQARGMIARLPVPARTISFLLLATGFRIGEALGLRWSRIDWEKGLLLAGAETYRNGVWKDGAKTKAGTRMVPLAPELALELRAWRAIAARTEPGDPVFADAEGLPLVARTLLDRDLRPLAKDMGIPAVTWHWFRHTATSLAEEHGATLSDRQKIMGHTDPAMTMHYTHEDLERMRGTLGRVASALVM